MVLQSYWHRGLWAAGGFMLGAVLSGAVTASVSSPSVPPAMPVSVEPKAGRPVMGRAVITVVNPDEVQAAIDTMRSMPEEQKSIRADLEKQRYRLLWLTVWDWSMQGVGDTVAITSNNFRRVIKLSHMQQRIAIPEPRSGSIEVEGLQAEDGRVAVSLLSGTQPIALPSMPVGARPRSKSSPPTHRLMRRLRPPRRKSRRRSPKSKRRLPLFAAQRGKVVKMAKMAKMVSRCCWPSWIVS
jgi:hypothetical protein